MKKSCTVHNVSSIEEEVVDFLLPSRARFDQFLGDLDALLPASEKKNDSQTSGGPGTTAQSVPYCGKVLQRLRHLGSSNRQMTHMYEIIHPLVLMLPLCPIGFTLSQLVVMMRKCQVDTTGVDVYMLSQLVRRHGRALNMPSRSSISPRTWPARLPGLGQFPERKICLIAFSSNSFLHIVARDCALTICL